MLRVLRLPFAAKVTMALLIAGLVPMSIVSWQNLDRFSQQARQAAEVSLSSMMTLKQSAVEAYFDSTVRTLETVVASPDALAALRGLNEAAESMRAIPPTALDVGAMKARYQMQEDAIAEASDGLAENWIDDLDETARLLQQMYIFGNPHPVGSKQSLVDAGDGSRYSALHQRFHPGFSDVLKRYGFYDVFLIEPGQARVVYSVFKETDFGTSLRSGAYRDTAFAKAAVQMIDSGGMGGAVYVDFSPYAPSNGAAAAFMLMPVRDGDRFAGVMAVQLPYDFANKVLHLTTGRYETEDSYIVSETRELRSQPLRDQTLVVGSAFDNDLTTQIFAGQGGTVEAINHKGLAVFADSVPLAIPGLDWRLVTELGRDEALAEATQSMAQAKRALAIIAVVILIAGLILARVLLLPIRRLGTDVQAQANIVVEALAAAAVQARGAAGTMAATAEETSRQTSSVQDNARQTAVSVDAVAGASEELSASIAQIVDGISRTALSVDAASAQAKDATVLLAELEHVAGRVTGIVGLIKEIANRTNLLALNAAVEAAHAGDAGRGFSVVAAEIRKLAASTADSTLQISTEIQTVIASVAQNSNAMRSISSAIAEVNSQAGTISTAARQQGEVTTDIAMRMSDTAARVNDVTSSISGVQEASVAAARAAGEVMAMVQNVDQATEQMTRAMAGFVQRIRTI